MVLMIKQLINYIVRNPRVIIWRPPSCRILRNSKTLRSAVFLLFSAHTMFCLSHLGWLISRKVSGKYSHAWHCTKYQTVIRYGNRYANSHYALAQVLSRLDNKPFIMWSYDIECQHSINRVAWFKKMFPDAVQTVERIVGCIPSMHIHNHKDDCQYRFAFKYTSNVGCTCGEESSKPGPKQMKQVAVPRRRIEATVTIALTISMVIGTGKKFSRWVCCKI